MRCFFLCLALVLLVAPARAEIIVGQSFTPAAAESGIALGTPWTAVGDSMTYGDYRLKSYTHWLNLALDGRLFFPTTYNRGNSSVYGGNAGVGGDTTSDIAARASTFNSHNGIYILLTGQNDNNSVTAGEQQTDLAAIFSELSSAEKIYVIPFAETSTVDGDSVIAARNVTNMAWLRGTASGTYSNLAVLSDDVWDGIELHDGMGGAGADSIDGVHPSNGGAFKLANNIFSEISGDLADGDAYDWMAGFTNVYPADLSGTSGTVDSDCSGNVATGLQLVASNMTGLTCVAAKGTLAGSTSQIITVTGTAGASVPEIYFREAITHAYNTDAGILMVGNIKVTASDGSSAPVGVQAIGLEAAYGKHIFGSRYSPANEGGVPFVVEGVFMNSPETHGSTLSGWSSDLAARLSPSTSIDVRIEFSDVMQFDVNDEGL